MSVITGPAAPQLVSQLPPGAFTPPRSHLRVLRRRQNPARNKVHTSSRAWSYTAAAGSSRHRGHTPAPKSTANLTSPETEVHAHRAQRHLQRRLARRVLQAHCNTESAAFSAGYSAATSTARRRRRTGAFAVHQIRVRAAAAAARRELPHGLSSTSATRRRLPAPTWATSAAELRSRVSWSTRARTLLAPSCRCRWSASYRRRRLLRRRRPCARSRFASSRTMRSTARRKLAGAPTAAAQRLPRGLRARR